MVEEVFAWVVGMGLDVEGSWLVGDCGVQMVMGMALRVVKVVVVEVLGIKGCHGWWFEWGWECCMLK